MSDGVAPPELRWGPDSLMTAVVQHAQTGEVLMVGHVNAESWRRTLETGRVWFWSRGRQELWEKGATSGNYLNLQSAQVDCDGDALLLLVLPEGPTCHTGARSCFHWQFDVTHAEVAPRIRDHAPAFGASTPLGELWQVIKERQRLMPEGSYVTYLLGEGIDKIDKKMGEEVAEVIVASKNAVPERLASELADLYFHSFVLLAAFGLTPDDVWQQLHGRQR